MNRSSSALAVNGTSPSGFSPSGFFRANDQISTQPVWGERPGTNPSIVTRFCSAVKWHLVIKSVSPSLSIAQPLWQCRGTRRAGLFPVRKEIFSSPCLLSVCLQHMIKLCSQIHRIGGCESAAMVILWPKSSMHNRDCRHDSWIEKKRYENQKKRIGFGFREATIITFPGLYDQFSNSRLSCVMRKSLSSNSLPKWK